MKHLFSDRIHSLPSSATLAMHQQAMALRAAGHAIINLGIGEPDFKTPLPIQQAAKQAIDSGKYFTYPPVAGYADLRAAIAQKLYQENHIPCKPSQIVVTHGAKQALAHVFLGLLNPGDEVVVYSPCWVSYNAMIRLAGGKPVLLQGRFANNFEPSPAQLAKAITPKTKAVIFSSPCNPTGHVLSKASLEAMVAVLTKHKDIFVIADEIYEYINFIGVHTSIASMAGMQDRVITINGFSKGFAMTGWRVGYLAAPEALAQACEKLQGQTTSAASCIAQRAALAAIQGDRKVLQAMTDAYRQRRDRLLPRLEALPGIRVNPPLGAFYLFPEVSHYFGHTDGQFVIQDAADFCRYLLQKAQVAVVPGSAFGAPNCVRISYAVAEDALQEALDRIKKALAQLSPGLN